jgi:hypothetical protein
LLAGMARADWKWGDRYSHAGHADRMRQKGQTSPACKSCHSLDARWQTVPPGKDEHKPCIDCHSGVDFSRGTRCLTCHSSIRTMKPGKPWYPPYRSPGDFHIQFSHGKHATMSFAEPCGGCHRPQMSGKSALAGHAQCGSCHASTAPVMNDCDGCHRPGPPPRQTLPTAVSAFRMVDFSHLAHEKAARGNRAWAAARVI